MKPADEVLAVDNLGRDCSELFDATVLLCVKYGGRVAFNAEFPPGAQLEFERMFAARGVRMHVQKSPGRSVMVCEGPLS